jgi:hypothetical protein
MKLKAGEAIYRLNRMGHPPPALGLKGEIGDVTRLVSRFRLARAFRGLDLEGYTEETVLGYNAFLQVFFTHSTLERYLDLLGLAIHDLGPALQPFAPGDVVRRFFEIDDKGKLFDFLHRRVNDSLKKRLVECRNGTCSNVGFISASVRHIFAHGHLTAHASDLIPARTFAACKLVSDYLLDFMDDHLCKVVAQYENRIERGGHAGR